MADRLNAALQDQSQRHSSIWRLNGKKPVSHLSHTKANDFIPTQEIDSWSGPMSGKLSPIDKAKFVAAKRAAQYVEDGMRVGLGTGSTAAWLVRCLGEMVRDNGLKIRGVPTSTRTAISTT